MKNFFSRRLFLIYSLTTAAIFCIPGAALGQDNMLAGDSAAVKELALKRDRATIIFNGTFYFTAPVDGRVTAAVFLGDGKFSARER